MDILSKIKIAGLVGRGGAGFPVEKKWLSVAKALESRTAENRKYFVVCNAAEGEPGLTKDGFILENYADKVIDGMKIAVAFLSLGQARDRSIANSQDKCAAKGYIYLNYGYSRKLNKKITALLKNSGIEIFVKPLNAGYIGGEESAVLNAIEGRKIEPRLRLPFPTSQGLWGFPTLVNNVETFYNVSLVNSGQYKNNRFYTISGDCPNEGVFELPCNFTIEKALKETKNYPKFNFFVQSGGNASGEVLNSGQLKKQVQGAGAITVYSMIKSNYKKVIKNWLDFYISESCGKCAPCREGSLRLKEVFMAEKVNWVLFDSLLDNLTDTSFCALGGSASVPIKSFIKNVYPQKIRLS